jgi:hypothetical protein
MFTPGINAAYHDSAACLVHDGQVVAAAHDLLASAAAGARIGST